jgi:HSP20 family protein
MTTLMRWNPLFSNSRSVPAFRNEFDSLFDNIFLRPDVRRSAEGFIPPADIQETAEGFVVRLDLPGVAQKDVKVTLTADTLTIRGERKAEESRENGGVQYRERSSGVYERTFQLTSPIRPDQVRATYRDGVLEVHVPKAEEAKTREIEVKVG